MISEERNGNEGQKLAKLAKMHFWYRKNDGSQNAHFVLDILGLLK